MNDRGGRAEDVFGLGGQGEYKEGPPPAGCNGWCDPEVPEPEVRGIAFDEATGDVYVADDALSGPTLQDFDEQGGGHIRVYTGIGASDARTGLPSSVGKTDATLTASVAQGEGPAVTNCLFQYVDEASYGNVRIVSVNGATGGRFKFSGSRNGFPTTRPRPRSKNRGNSSRGRTSPVPPAAPGGSKPTARNSARSRSKTEVRANELKPLGVKVSIDWEAATAPCQPSPTGDVHADVSGLANGATYRYRVVATSSAGRVFGSIETLTTTPGEVQTGAATEIEPNSATLNGTVDPENLSTTYYFEYGRTPDYGSTSSSPPGQDVGTTAPGDQPVDDPITGLEAGKTYHYRIVAVNANGTSRGSDRTFVTTAAVQGVETLPATEVNRGDAMLHGKLDPNGAETHYYFELGTSRRYGTTSATPPGTNLVDTSPGVKPVDFHATGLRSDTTYHYRLVATSSLGTTYGGDQSFTTPTAVIGVSTDPATDEKTESAVLHGKLDPDGIPSSYYFQYGKTLAYGQAAPLPPGIDLADSSPGVQSVEYLLEGLEPGTTYHYRMVGANFSGSTVGNDQTFTTKEGPAIEGVTSDEVTASSAKLLGKINPNGYATKWFFEYGLTEDYGTTAPVTVETLERSQPGSPSRSRSPASRT